MRKVLLSSLVGSAALALAACAPLEERSARCTATENGDVLEAVALIDPDGDVWEYQTDEGTISPENEDYDCTLIGGTSNPGVTYGPPSSR